MTDDLVKRLPQFGELTLPMWQDWLVRYNDVLTARERRIEQLESLFPAILDYLEGQADVVDGDNGIPAPNRAMSLLVWTKHTLEGKDG